MPRQSAPRPTDAELEILAVLWQRGASTVREIHEQINQTKPTGYTTVLKFLQIMTEKNLVVRDERQRAHVYSARLTQEQTQKQLVSDLLTRAFDNSASQLVMQALNARRVSDEEMTEIHALLEEAERKAKR